MWSFDDFEIGVGIGCEEAEDVADAQGPTDVQEISSFIELLFLDAFGRIR